MRYEDLIANTAAILKATFSHVQETAVVARDRGVGRVRDQSQAVTVSPLDAKRSRKIGGWKNHFLDGTTAHFLAICGDRLRASGYQPH